MTAIVIEHPPDSVGARFQRARTIGYSDCSAKSVGLPAFAQGFGAPDRLICPRGFDSLRKPDVVPAIALAKAEA